MYLCNLFSNLKKYFIMKKLFYFFSLITIVLSFCSCGQNATMVGTYWKGSQEHSAAKYLKITEEEAIMQGLSGTLTFTYDLKFISENEAKMKIKLKGTIYHQFEEGGAKIVYMNVDKDDEFGMSYTFETKKWKGVLTAKQTSALWEHPPINFTLFENAMYLILEIDNQDVILKSGYSAD